jgi:phage repressor protein C with HTH and peptisase S24 domain
VSIPLNYYRTGSTSTIIIVRPSYYLRSNPVMMIDSSALQKARLAKALSQPALARLAGCSQQLIGALEKGTTKTTKFLPRIAKALGVDPGILDPDWSGRPSQNRDGNVIHPSRFNPNDRNPTLNVIPGADLVGEEDLPVYSIVQAGRGALVLENDPFTHTSRPRRLVGIAKGYGVRVKGNSMSPEYNEDDIAFVDPTLNPRKGDPCVFQGEREDGTVEAMMKYLDRSPDAHPTLYYVRTGLGADKVEKFTVKKADWQKCHVVVGKESGR